MRQPDCGRAVSLCDLLMQMTLQPATKGQQRGLFGIDPTDGELVETKRTCL